MIRLTLIVALAFLLSACAGLRSGWMGELGMMGAAPSSALRGATQVAALPPARQQAVCADARAKLGGVDVRDSDRLALAALALVVPGCLSTADVQRLLRGLPDSTLTGYLRVLATRQADDSRVLAQTQEQVESLQAKLKALTSIEQQLNQVKDRELQPSGQGKTSPR